MNVEFDRYFSKSLEKIDNQIILNKLKNIIIDLEKANSIWEVNSIKKLNGFKKYYRIKINDYRLGFELISPSHLKIIIIAHRKKIYQIFP